MRCLTKWPDTIPPLRPAWELPISFPIKLEIPFFSLLPYRSVHAEQRSKVSYVWSVSDIITISG
jgi:hypothetical protein